MTENASEQPDHTPEDPLLVQAREAFARVDAGALLVDVRSDRGREREGEIDGAVVVDRNRLPELFSDESPLKALRDVEKEQEIVVLCGSINGSRPVAEWLTVNGYDNVSHVDGGFAAYKAERDGETS